MLNSAEKRDGQAVWQTLPSLLINPAFPRGNLGRMFHLDFLVGVLSLDEGLVRWDQLRRSDDSATIVETMAVEGIACGGWTAMTLITHQA